MGNLMWDSISGSHPEPKARCSTAEPPMHPSMLTFLKRKTEIGKGKGLFISLLQIFFSASKTGFLDLSTVTFLVIGAVPCM